MSKSESNSPEYPEGLMSDDSKDSFPLSKLSKRSSKRVYRKHQPIVSDPGESRRKEGTDSSRRDKYSQEDRRDSRGREEKRRRRADDRHRRERSYELYEREKHERDAGRDYLLVSKRRDERTYDSRNRSRSPIQPPQRYEQPSRYRSHEHSRGKTDRSGQLISNKRKKEVHTKDSQGSLRSYQESNSDSDGEIKPPLEKRRSEPKNVYVESFIKDLDSHSSGDSEEESHDSGRNSKEGMSTPPSEKIDSSSAAQVERRQAKTWRDIADESSESENEQNTDSEKAEDDKKFIQLSEPLLKYPGIQSVSSSDIDETEKDTPGVPPSDPETVPQSMEEEVTEMDEEEKEEEMPELPPYLPGLMGCRSVECYEWLNRIEEGTYGVVFRGKEKRTGEVVALKKLKMEKEREGFPITSLREINMLLKSSHPNIVHVREIVVGSNMDKIYIVMDYVEHDLKSLMETMKQPFLEGEVKTLMIQLLKAVHHLHDNWILHRDLKTSNLLLSHKGILKVADFGLAREYGSPLKRYTPIVVTLWYRCPELLLEAKEYSTAVDVWSVGCIFAELLQHKPLFMGKSEIDQLNQIFKELGTPNDEIWPGYSDLPIAKKVDFAKQPLNNLRKRFPMITNAGFNLLNKFLTFDPKRRITAEDGFRHSYFEESPLPVDPSMFPTWPAKSEMVKKQKRERSPTAPEGGAFLLNQVKEKDDEEGKFHLTSAQAGKAAVGPGFTLKF